MLVILGTQEAEIKKIKFKASLGNSSETLSRKNPSQKKGWLSSSRYKPWIQVPVLPKKKKKDRKKENKGYPLLRKITKEFRQDQTVEKSLKMMKISEISVILRTVFHTI
jgi:hypothetical protein